MLLALLVAAETHFAAGAGVGLAYAYAGPRLEARAGPVGVFVATGLPMWVDVLGLAAYPRAEMRGGVGGGLFVRTPYVIVSGQVTWLGYRYPHDIGPEFHPDFSGSRTTATLTVGRRQDVGDRFFVEAAAGGGVRIAADDGLNDNGTTPIPSSHVAFQPDFSLGFGVTF